MDTSELLLAAEVRKLAMQIRTNRWTAFAAAANIMTEGSKHPLQYDQVKARWELDHPISNYIPDAVGQLKNIAFQVRALATND